MRRSEGPSPAEAEARFVRVYDETAQALLAYALRRVDDPQDAADVVAETFVVAWRRLADVPEGDEARPWLYGVARRVLANHHRGERRRSALTERLREQVREVVVHEPDETSHVATALASLSEKDQEILRLVAWEGLAGNDLAAALDCSPVAARVRLHRARSRLRAALDAAAREQVTCSAAKGVLLKQISDPGHVVGGWAIAHRGSEERS